MHITTVRISSVEAWTKEIYKRAKILKLHFKKLQNNMAIILCMCVCLCVCVCVCVCVRVRACMHAWMFVDSLYMHPHAHTLSELTDFVVELSSG